MNEKRFWKAEICSPTKESQCLFDQLKAEGFDGIEVMNWDVSPSDAAATRKVAESAGLKIHSVMRAWLDLNTPDQTSINRDLDSMTTAIRAAAAYGAEVVLFVPCRVGEIAMPEPWEFQIDFDPKTLHLNQVVAGDNEPYRDYIKAHDFATEMTRKHVETLIPEAERNGVVLALENVWNNLWVEPDFFAALVRSFDSPWIGAYFDIGNHVKYGKSENWIRALGDLIVRLHVKDFKLNDDGRDGNFADILTGSVDWPAVRRAIDEIGYRGWLTIEYQEDRLSNEDAVRRLDRIISGDFTKPGHRH